MVLLSCNPNTLGAEVGKFGQTGGQSILSCKFQFIQGYIDEVNPKKQNKNQINNGNKVFQ